MRIQLDPAHPRDGIITAVARIVWRLTHKRPPLGGHLKAGERILARTVHSLFYILITFPIRKRLVDEHTHVLFEAIRFTVPISVICFTQTSIFYNGGRVAKD